MKLLFHSCCAPCSIQCVEALAADKFSLELFWFNPNIHPYTEYRSRLDSLRDFAKQKNLPCIIEGDYGLRMFLQGNGEWGIGSDELEKVSGSKRCEFCYRLRLEKAASYAVAQGYEAFSTTLLISPYQDHELIKRTGEEMAALYGIDFFYRDFRPLFRDGQNMARSAGYYMQKYCGCVFSEEERYLAGKGRL